LKGEGKVGRALLIEQSESRLSFLPQAGVEVDDQRLFALLITVVARIPNTRPPIPSVRTICFRKRSNMKGIVGLTKYSFVEYKVKGAKEWRVPDPGRHTVTFYTRLMNQLSDEAVMAVIAHEFAHAWLNEYVRPAQSQKREREADELAREWGFEHELHALEAETEPFSKS
jgi:hypothetical protein